MTRDAASRIRTWHSCFLTQQRNHHIIQVAIPDAPSPVREQKIDLFIRFAIKATRLRETLFLPPLDVGSNESVDGFPEGCARFVHRNVQEAGRIFRRSLTFFRLHFVFPLPSNTANTEPLEFI